MLSFFRFCLNGLKMSNDNLNQPKDLKQFIVKVNDWRKNCCFTVFYVCSLKCFNVSMQETLLLWQVVCRLVTNHVTFIDAVFAGECSTKTYSLFERRKEQ